MISNETAVMDTEKEPGITPQKALYARSLRYDALLVLITMIWAQLNCACRHLRDSCSKFL